jgi:hypothetical protein
MMDILRDHDGGICMHGGFETTASMVSRIGGIGEAEHWLIGRPHPCRSPFRPVSFPDPAVRNGQESAIPASR